MTPPRKGLRALLLLGALTLLGAVPLHNAQSGLEPRLGRPWDWSHNHVVAARGGPDGGWRIYSDWRPWFRHVEIDQTRAAIQRAKQRPRSSGLPSSQRFALWLKLTGFALLGAILVGQKLKKRKLRTRWPLILLLSFLGFLIACGASPADPKPSMNSSGLDLDWSLNTGGFGNVISFPAKFSLDISASNCSDVIYFTVDQSGGPSTVNVIALTNPYAGCPGNPAGSTPTVKFGIALGNGTATSPVLSLDGSVLYVIESRPSLSGGPVLHAINVNNITVNPGSYDFATGTWTSVHALAGCPCGLGSEQLFELAFAGVDNNRSSPYLDYPNNQIFFGDSLGRLHRVINTNTTTASEDTANFPVTCGAAELRAPVFVNGLVITASADGRVYKIDTTVAPPFTCVASAAVGTGANAGELASPVIDVTNSKIIVVTGRDSGPPGGSKRMALFDLGFAAGAAPLSSILLGQANNAVRPRIPAFDNAFLTTNNGNLYVGGAPTGGGNVYLIRVPYNGTAFGAAAGFAELHRSGAAGSRNSSPVTAFLTASSLANPDFVFVGGSGGTYLFMNRIATGFVGTDAAPVAVDGFFAVPGGADSGIIVDNRTMGVTTPAATANIYFGTLGVAATSTQSTVVQLGQQF